MLQIKHNEKENETAARRENDFKGLKDYVRRNNSLEDEFSHAEDRGATCQSFAGGRS